MLTLFSLHFGLATSRILTILTSAAFRGACLLEGGTYFNGDTQRHGTY